MDCGEWRDAVIHILTADGQRQNVPDPLVLVVGHQAYEVRETGRGRLTMFPVTKKVDTRPTGADDAHQL